MITEVVGIESAECSIVSAGAKPTNWRENMTRHTLFGAIALLATFSAVVHAQDPKAVSPEMYEVLYENDTIRIIQVTYEPGQSDALHSHPRYIAYVLESGSLRVHSRDGGEPQIRVAERGQIMVQEPAAHWAENIGDTVVKAVFMEIKDEPSGSR